MSITVLDAIPSTMLTTVAKLKAMLTISTSDYDEILEDVIQSASAFTVKFTGREFAQQRVTEDLAGKGSPDLVLSITPIVSIESVLFDTGEITDYSIYSKESGIIQRRSGFTNTNIPFNTIDYAPSSYYEKRWHVTYTGGYVLPSFPKNTYPTRTLPFDLERAVLEIAKTGFLSLKHDGSMTRYKIGETQIYWDRKNGEGAMPANAEKVLNYYKRWE